MYESDEEVKEKYEEIMTRLMELIELVKKSDDEEDDPNLYFG